MPRHILHAYACNCIRKHTTDERRGTLMMQTLSARIPSEDMEWLMALDIPGAVSPSDKLRAMVAQMRRQHEGALDYDRSLAWLRELLTPSVAAIRGFEHHNRMHSEPLTLVAEWLPQIMATL